MRTEGSEELFDITYDMNDIGSIVRDLLSLPRSATDYCSLRLLNIQTSGNGPSRNSELG
jgi:hypothetical protein